MNPLLKKDLKRDRDEAALKHADITLASPNSQIWCLSKNSFENGFDTAVPLVEANTIKRVLELLRDGVPIGIDGSNNVADWLELELKTDTFIK